MKDQFLNSMDLEQEKGITIKMHPVHMKYQMRGVDYMLNLIDTPGHIDFSYEISRALACVEGAVVLVDATRGIQAQTLFNLEEAKKQNLKIIGAVNKIDVPQARVEETRKELSLILNVEEKEIFLISSKTGQNVKDLLHAIISNFPPPKLKKEASFSRSLVFDSKYDSFSGVVAYIRVFEGEIKKWDKIHLIVGDIETEVKEVGIFIPEQKPLERLESGEIGYVKTGIKEPGKLKVGDTITTNYRLQAESCRVQALPGYKEPQPVMFLSIYPENADEFEELKRALEKLKLTDPSLDFKLEADPYHSSDNKVLGRGIKIGFLGSLQAEIILRRIRQEFGLDVISTAPQVVFKVTNQENREFEISSPGDWPEPERGQIIKESWEPWAKVEVIVPNEYFSQVFKVLQNFNAELKDTQTLTSEKSLLIIEAPLREVIGGKFYEDIKSKTAGYASFSFDQIGFKKTDLVRLDILIGGKKFETFSRIIPRDKVFSEGKSFVEKLKEILPSQQFSLALQAVVGGKVIARETIKAKRKDVTAPLYGGDVTRKRKLLEIQKRGKEEMREKSRIRIPSEAYLKMLKF